MTTMTTRIPWFEMTIPAKLARSSYLVWLALCVCTVVLSSGFVKTRTALSTLSYQALPATVASAHMFTDFGGMEENMRLQLESTNEQSHAQARIDFAHWRDKALADIDSASHIRTTPWLPWQDAENKDLALSLSDIASAFRTYDEDVNATIAAHDRADAPLTATSLTKAKKDLAEVLYPATLRFDKAGTASLQGSLETSTASYKSLTRELYIAGALLAALLVWQYTFMLKNCKIVVQATLLTFVLSAFAFGYAYNSLREVNHHLVQVMNEDAPQLSPSGLTVLKYKVISGKAVEDGKSDFPYVLNGDKQVDIAAASIEHKLNVGGIEYMPGLLAIFFLAGLFYKLAVARALRDYR